MKRVDVIGHTAAIVVWCVVLAMSVQRRVYVGAAVALGMIVSQVVTFVVRVIRARRARQGRRPVRSVRSGDWSDPRTWDTGRVPSVCDTVEIVRGHTVTTGRAIP